MFQHYQPGRRRGTSVTRLSHDCYSNVYLEARHVRALRGESLPETLEGPLVRDAASDLAAGAGVSGLLRGPRLVRGPRPRGAFDARVALADVVAAVIMPDGGRHTLP